MSSGKYFMNGVFILMLVVSALGNIALVAQAGNGNDEPKADPRLLQMASENPDATFMVIVQREVKNKDLQEDDPETAVEKGGGKVKKQLQMIESFSAELTGIEIEKLARNPKVRWISADAPMFQAATKTSTLTWATDVGTLISPNGFTNAANMADSALGGNSTFGNGSKVKGSFTGLAPETTPANAITKVEIALRIYTSGVLSGGDDPHVMLYVGGKQVKNYGINHAAFAPFAGAANAGILYVDFTPGYKWTWGDFEQGVEIVIDQSMFNSGHIIYYDAVGLRLTSDVGTDITSGSVASSATPDVTDASKLVNVYNKVIRADQVWNGSVKLQGKGVTVAVVDSGFYPTKDIKWRVKKSVNFNMADHTTADLYGHGTFVAGIVGGNGINSGGKYIGVAPNVNLVNVRVSDDQGMSYESDVINGLQWVLNNKATYNIRVVNMSLNSSVAQSYNTSPLDAAAEILWFNGIVMVVSAGNNGGGTVYPPANDPFVITVGATDDKGTLSASDDTLATFTAYGLAENGLVKPDLVTPGRNIIGLLPDNNSLTIGKAHPANRVDWTYFRMSGTSISAPMVSGAVAILLQDEPNLTPDQVKYRLTSTANKTWADYSSTTSGAGYLDVYAAVTGTTTQSANTGILPSNLLTTGTNPITFGSVGWNSVGWNSVGWNSVGWNSDYWGP